MASIYFVALFLIDAKKISLILWKNYYHFLKNEMYKKILSIILIALCELTSYAATDQIVLRKTNQQHDHSEYYPPADLPEVYFDSDNLEIILVADGFSTYYDVEITPTTGYVPLISTQVDGYGDTIDVSSLPDGYYTITITSEFNNEFEGTFQIE